jgi:hypothetical protein
VGNFNGQLRQACLHKEELGEAGMQPSAFGVIAASLLLVVFLCSPFADLLVGGHARYRSERSNL